MEYRQLGGSGLKVPALSFGTGTFGGVGEQFKAWGATDVAEATRLVDICLDAGLNMFDSADMYSNGAAEEILGAAIKGRRNQVLVSTKGTFQFGPGVNDVGSSRHHLTQAVEGSLRRLGTDYIDLYQLHGFDALTPVEEALSTLERFRARRENPLHRLFEFLRLASDEIARSIGSLRLAALRGPSGLLLAHRARLRMGADAAGAGSKGGGRNLEPVGVGALTGKIRRGQAVAGDQPFAESESDGYRAAGRSGILVSRDRCAR